MADPHFAALLEHVDGAARNLERLLDRFRDLSMFFTINPRPRDHELQRRRFREIDFLEIAHLVIDPDPVVPGLDQLPEDLIAIFGVEEDRRQNHGALSAEKLGDRVGNRFRRLLPHDDLAVGTSGLAAVGHEEADVVGKLGGGRDRGPSVLDRVFLLDRDRRQDAFDFVDVRTIDPFEELPDIGRHRLHEPSLPLGIEGVECERGLSRTRRARQHRELALRDIDRNVLEIVGPRPSNRDRTRGHIRT